MLEIVIQATEAWDEVNEKFISTKETKLSLQHSLVSLAKWEAIFKKPFLSKDPKTIDETYGYIQAMSESPVNVESIKMMTQEDMLAINAYIEDSNTATWFKEVPGAPKSREVVTSEIIYYWMWALQIPMEAQYWHLSRLFTQIRVVNEKNQPKKKVSKAEALAQQRQLNAERLAKTGSSG